MRRIFVLGVLAVVVATAGGTQWARASAVEQVTLDLEGFAKGQIVSSVPHPGSDRTIRIVGINPHFSQNAAVIFDSADPSANDVDLGTPHRDFDFPIDSPNPIPGPGEGEGGRRGELCQNDRHLGKLLIVDDDLAPAAADGRVAVPDDEGHAGARLLIDFADLGEVTIHDLAIIDVEEPDAVIWLYSVGIEERQRRARKKQVLARYRVHTDDNGVAMLFDPELREASEAGCHVSLMSRRHGEPLEPVEGVKCIEAVFSGSGGIARLTYSVAGEAGG